MSPTQTAPSVGVSSRFMQRRSVLLPEPEGPIIDTTSPGSITSEAFLSTVRSPNDLLTLTRRTRLRERTRTGGSIASEATVHHLLELYLSDRRDRRKHE